MERLVDVICLIYSSSWVRSPNAVLPKLYERLFMSMVFFANDGSYGDATDLVVLNCEHFNNEDWLAIDEANDYDRLPIARTLAKHYADMV